MRSLPERRNPLVAAAKTPDYDKLLDLRRLGRTRLTVKPGQVGTSNATKAENLGPVEYAHLRAPLPDNLDGSEIFATNNGLSPPETYFLMRRSQDGYLSATGMFKIAFPWATHAEEKAERDFLKSLATTSQEEIAGNVWIAPDHALKLADEYGLSSWIRALLDPTDIVQSPSSTKKPIAEPPKFNSVLEDRVKLVPSSSSKGARARSIRSTSPIKAAATPSKAKSPTKKRQTKAQKEASIAATNAASAALQSALDDAASVAGDSEIATEVALVNGEVSDRVRVEVDQAVEVNGDTEVTHTNVTVSMPAGLPELPIPEDTEAMLDKAKQMVEEAKLLEAVDGEGSSSSPRVIRKRKVDEVEPSDIDNELPVQPAKKAKVLEEKLKRERVRNRAMIGVGAMLGIAAAIPYFF